MIFSFPLPVLKTNSNTLFEESPSEKDLSLPEPELPKPAHTTKDCLCTQVGTRFEAGVRYSLLSLTLAVTLETYKLPDSDEEVAEEEAIRRVLKQVRSGSCGRVYLPLNYSQCVCYLVSEQRMYFCSWAEFPSSPLLVLFQYLLRWAIQLRAIDKHDF